MDTNIDQSPTTTILDTLPADSIRVPNMPIHTFIQEAEDLHHWCQKDKEALTGAGLGWSIVDDLPHRARLLREAESHWFRERFSREEAEKEWNQSSPRAYELRDRLLRAMRYAFRNDAAILKRVSQITAGTGHADMIQDLNDIAHLGRDNPAPLQAINLDLAELDLAATLSQEMGSLLAKVNGDRMENSSAKIRRDRAYTWLKLAVEEIRACGQYALFNNAERRNGYTSQYFRLRRTGSNDAGSNATPEATT